MSDTLFVFIQHLLPKRQLTELMGWLASREGEALTHWAIERFIHKYRVNMGEAINPNPKSYASFNEFFTRPLSASARPIASNEWVCPVDGALSQAGPIQGDQLFQAKGHHYTAQALLGGDAQLGNRFKNGYFATIYLSPRDYHRLHMPCDGKLLRVIYVPGDLYSVNPATARGVPGLFARNERVVCIFETMDNSGRRFALVLVGATIVGSIATVWTGVVNKNRNARTATDVTPDSTKSPTSFLVKKGDEMGRFLLGSTIVMLAQSSPASPWPLLCDAQEGQPVKLGEPI